jgi:hypothetical protein
MAKRNAPPHKDPKKCRYCGGGTGNLIWVATDELDWGAQHSDPYQCIAELRKSISQITGRTAHLVTFG